MYINKYTCMCTYIYIYIYIYVCVCVYVYLCVIVCNYFTFLLLCMFTEQLCKNKNIYLVYYVLNS